MTAPHDPKAELDDDPLLAALRQLPPVAMDPPVETRLQRQARAAYVRRFEGSAWDSPAATLVGRAAVPVFLAGVVGLYMTWAVSVATALFQ
ncbi:MAG: hypothetical protein JWP87_3556 [Labilithrix sp.]|nr:hypothetical protein [Labilithrix sp.]